MLRKRDYQQKKFRNPFFSKKTKVGKRQPRLKIYIFLLILIFLFGLYFVNTNSYFKIINVEIKGNQTIDSKDVIALVSQQLTKNRFFIFNQDSIFFFSKRQAKKVLNENYSLENVKVNKDFFNAIVIEIKEIEPALVWIFGGKQFYLNKEGGVIKEVGLSDLNVQPGEEGTEIIRVGSSIYDYPTVYDLSDKEPIPGQLVASEEFINFITELDSALRDNADFEVSYYTIPTLYAEEATMFTNEGWQVHFKTTDSVIAQVNRLFLILQRKVENRSNLQYIDLRFGDKIFYK